MMCTVRIFFVFVLQMCLLVILRGYLLTMICSSLAVWVGYFYFRKGKSKSRRNRFNSFAPVRKNCLAKWFVDGQDYMSAVADAIEAASNEIFITDWQISPHIYMKRPDTGVDSLKWRLDKMLLKKADQGVRVYILLYFESKKIAGMDLGSRFAQSILRHQNIVVLRHPDEYTMIRYGSKGTGLWSHHEKVVVVDRSIAFVGGIDLCFGRWDTHNHELIDNYDVHPCAEEEDCHTADAEVRRYSRWIGDDYVNTFQGGSGKQLDRSRVPRMPWHDVGCAFTGPPAHDVAKHFIQRYNSIRNPWWKFWSFQQLFIMEHSDNDHIISDPSARNLKIQVLRSVDKWSAEQTHEASIHNAYLHAIEKAKHFIYIENQFFISSQPGVFLKVENQIMSALADRIVHAYQNNEDFHVVVVMPLKPEFPGEWGTSFFRKDKESISYWNYLTINNGEDSLYSRLEKGGIPQSEIHHYFSVYALRTHATLNDNLVTEIVYVHSKLMIVDDRIAIIGSANINDRSMLGSRDSEVAVFIEDTEMIDGKMDGHPFQVGKFSHSLRCHLIREHLDLLDSYESSFLKVEDPLTVSFLHVVWIIAQKNTQIYDLVFGGKIDPPNNVKNLDDLKNARLETGITDPDEAKEELRDIQGRLVMHPEFFLKDILKPSYLDVFGMYVDNRGYASNPNFDKPTGTVFA